MAKLSDCKTGVQYRAARLQVAKPPTNVSTARPDVSPLRQDGIYEDCQVRFEDGWCFIQLNEGNHGDGRIDAYPASQIVAAVGLSEA